MVGHMRSRWLIAVAVCFAFALTSCVSAGPRPAASPTISRATPDASPTPAVSVDQLTITLDGIVHSHDDNHELVPLSDGQGLLALFQKLTGVMPAGVVLGSPYENTGWQQTSYEWSAVRVVITPEGKASGIRILAPAVNGVPIQTQEGISVGSKRAEVVAAHGWDIYDENGDGLAETIGLGSREVPGTQSLSHLGAVGIEYILLVMTGDAVEQILVPADDFSDV